ncbi:MAG: ABC transporter permease [Acidimicrobiia bacterium]
MPKGPVPLTPGLRWWRRLKRHRAGIVSLVVVVVVVLATLIGPHLVPSHYAATDFAAIRQAPSSSHLLGTDELGRDILVRVLVGGRVSLAVAVGSQVLAIVFATVMGLMAGYWTRWADTLIMRAIDLFMSIPDLLLLILLIPVLSGALRAGWVPQWLTDANRASGGILGLVLGIALITWTVVARLVRGQVLSLREEDFVEAAVSIGASRARVMRRHLLPNLTTVLVVAATLGVPRGVLLESGISFLGLGVNPPLPSWGTMIADALGVMRSSPHVLLAPAVVLSITVLSLNMLGDAVRDAVDPRSGS